MQVPGVFETARSAQRVTVCAFASSQRMSVRVESPLNRLLRIFRERPDLLQVAASTSEPRWTRTCH
jgi:hypothetical protein